MLGLKLIHARRGLQTSASDLIFSCLRWISCIIYQIFLFDEPYMRQQASIQRKRFLKNSKGHDALAMPMTTKEPSYIIIQQSIQLLDICIDIYMIRTQLCGNLSWINCVWWTKFTNQLKETHSIAPHSISSLLFHWVCEIWSTDSAGLQNSKDWV